MSERKVLNKYYPPDFDPSKIKRRKGLNAGNSQITIRLMAPFSMRCTRCGEYVYKGKKFNARKETAKEEYYGIRVFRFYIKCPTCSSEITFKTDPKNADYICEHGATRNFENWQESDTKNIGAIPDAAADDEYDSEGNPLEERREKDAMADLERSQEQSRREMELMDELADLRQRNARLELSNVGSDPSAVLAALHAERESAEEEARRKADAEEDDALVAQYFAKVPAGPSGTNGESSADVTRNGHGNGKGKAKGEEADDVVSDEASDVDSDESDEAVAAPAALTIKRRPPPAANGGASAEPSVASLLAARSKALETKKDGPANGHGNGNGKLNGNGNGAAGAGMTNAVVAGQAAAKRKREGLQKKMGIMGIKKKK